MQFLSLGVVYNGESSPKKKFNSLSADFGESDPWTALNLGLPGVPNLALTLLGASLIALSTFVGPINYLHFAIELSATSSKPIATPLVTNSTRPSKNGRP